MNGVKNGASEWCHISSKASGEDKMLLWKLVALGGVWVSGCI